MPEINEQSAIDFYFAIKAMVEINTGETYEEVSDATNEALRAVQRMSTNKFYQMTNKQVGGIISDQRDVRVQAQGGQ